MDNRSSASSGLSPWLIRGMIALLALTATLLPEWLPGADSHPPAVDAWLRDVRLRMGAAATAETRIALVDIDEASIQHLGPWPWPRGRIADLAELLLARYGARSVALDMVLPEPGHDDGDARLAALSQHAPLVLAQALDFVPRPAPLRVGQTIPMPAPGGAPPAVPATGHIANHPGLGAARCAGNIGFVPDADGVLRRIPLLSAFEGRTYPALSLALLACDGAAPAWPEIPAGGFWALPYPRELSAYTVIRAEDILSGGAPVARIEGRRVIVGSSALGLGDRVATPLSASTPGSLVHATALTALLDLQAGAAPAPWPGRLIASTFAALVVALALAGLPRLPAGRSLLCLLLAALAWLAIAFAAIPHDAGFAPAAPLFTLLVLLTFAIPYEWGRAQWESRRLLDMFRHYVAPPVIEELMRARGHLDPLAPRHTEVTTLISDMEGYARLVEDGSLDDAVALTRGFLDCLTDPVLASGGTLDKYTGDGLMAFWGAPLPMADHADRALAAAGEIRRRVADFNLRRAAQGKPAVRVRIGIESGPAMVGDLGTAFRSAYTAVGDSVNVASRLQELARELPHDILVGPQAARLATCGPLLPLGRTAIRGRLQEAEIFALDAAATHNAGSPPAATIPPA